jgi:hypothetical protein
LAKLGTKFLKERPLSFAIYDITRIPRLFWHDTTVDTVANDFKIPQNLKPGEMDINVIKDIFQGKIGAGLKKLTVHPIWILSLFLKTLTLILSLLAFAHFFLFWKFTGQISKVSLFLFLFILLYGVMASPVGMQRYRVPIEPFLLILAFDSVRLIYRRFWHLTLV